MKAILKFRDWVFEIDKEYTELQYQTINNSGADTCKCSECKNYITNRNNIFPLEIIENSITKL